MGSDHYLYYQRNGKKIERENLDIRINEIKKRDKNQYELSLEKVKERELKGEWCMWDKSYIEEYEEYQKHKDDEYISVELAYYGKHWNLSCLIAFMCEKHKKIKIDKADYDFYCAYKDIELTKDMIEEMYKLHVEHFEGKDTLKEACGEFWSEEKAWKLEYSMRDLKAILDDKTIDWENDFIYYYEN